MVFEVLVKFEQRVPVPTHRVSARCGEGEVTIEVKQNFLGNGCLNWSVAGGGFFAGKQVEEAAVAISCAFCSVLLMSEKQRFQVRDPNWKIEWNRDTQCWLLQMAQTMDSQINIMFPLISSLWEGPFGLLKRCLYSDALRILFICPVAEPALAVSVIDWTRKRNSLR